MPEMGSPMHLGRSKSKCSSLYKLAIKYVNMIRRRHLLRLWLRDPKLAWKTPDALKDRWDALYKDVTPEEQVFPLEPKIRGGAGKV